MGTLGRSNAELELAMAEAGEIDPDFQLAIEENAGVIERKNRELGLLAAKIAELEGKQPGRATAAEVRNFRQNVQKMAAEICRIS